jgi:hypothetical protein
MMSEVEKRLSKAGSKAGHLQRHCLKLLAEHQRDGAIPTSGRFLFYELVSRSVVPKDHYVDENGKKKSRTPAQDVADALWHLRRKSRIVPMNWIVDETRDLDSWQYASSVYEYVDDSLPDARIDLWGGEPPPLIICESRSLAGVLRRIAYDYLCPIAATNGQVGGFLHTTIGPLIEDGGGFRRVLYFGDLDLSGGHIEENTRGELSEYGELDWERLAVTDVQVRAENLTIAMKKDKRYKPPLEFPAVETEALKQQKIQRILLDTLDDALPQPLDEMQEVEQAQRVQVRKALRGIEPGAEDDKVTEAEEEGEDDE